jgi:hypothetical protein
MLCRRIARKLPFAAVFLALLSVLPAAAETYRLVFPTKFLCGFSDGRVPKLNDPAPLPAPYRAVEPGNYATIINIANLSAAGKNAALFEAVWVAGQAQVVMGNVNLPPTQVSTIDCVAITAALAQQGFPNDGRFVEGYVSIYSDENPPLDVTVAYSYAIHRADATGIGLGSSAQVLHIEPRRILVQPE